MESNDIPHAQGDHVDSTHAFGVGAGGYERESGTARADRVDEIAAETGEKGQEAGEGPRGTGTSGKDD